MKDTDFTQKENVGKWRNELANHRIKLIRKNDSKKIIEEMHKSEEYYDKFLEVVTNEYEEFKNTHSSPELLDDSVHQMSFYKTIVEYVKLNEPNHLSSKLGWPVMKKLVELKTPLLLIHDHYIHNEELGVSCYDDITEIIWDYFQYEDVEGRDLDD